MISWMRQKRKQWKARTQTHVDETDGDIWVMIVGSNESGFTLKFDPSKETTVDAEFKAMPQDTDGTLITYQEEIIPAA